MEMTRRSLLRVGLGGVSTALVSTSPVARALAVPSPARLAGGGRFAGDPGSGRMYYGASLEGDLYTFESKISQPLALHRTYYGYWQVDLLIGRAKDDLANHRLPHVSIKLPGTWRDIANGYHDAWLGNLADRLNNVGGPVFLTLHHEPENDAGGTGMHAKGFVAMNSHAIEMMGNRAPQVTVVPVLMAWSFSPQSGTDVARWIVPGAAVLGVDVYNPWSPTNGKPWLTFAERLQMIQPYVGSRPIAIGEYGCRTDPRNPGRAADWMRDAFAYARNNNIISMSYFNSGRNSPDGTWVLDDERRPVFAAELSSDAVIRP